MPGKSWRIGADTTTRTDPIAKSAKYRRFCCTTLVAHPARHQRLKRKTPASDEVTKGSQHLGVDCKNNRGLLRARFKEDLASSGRLMLSGDLLVSQVPLSDRVSFDVSACNNRIWPSVIIRQGNWQPKRDVLPDCKNTRAARTT